MRNRTVSLWINQSGNCPCQRIGKRDKPAERNIPCRRVRKRDKPAERSVPCQRVRKRDKPELKKF